MKILAIHNDHIKPKSERKYGCICNKCGTVFIFTRSEACIPRSIDPNPNQCTVRCPNSSCQNVMTFELCKEFKTLKDENDFCDFYVDDK